MSKASAFYCFVSAIFNIFTVLFFYKIWRWTPPKRPGLSGESRLPTPLLLNTASFVFEHHFLINGYKKPKNIQCETTPCLITAARQEPCCCVMWLFFVFFMLFQ